MDIIELVSSARVTADNPLLPPPEKLFGFTYVSFFIEKTTFPARKHNAVIELTTPKSQTTMTRGVFDFQGGVTSNQKDYTSSQNDKLLRQLELSAPCRC